MTAHAPRRFVVAPSGFKESLSADQAADAIVAGVWRVVPGAVVHCLPLVDGGEGTAATLARATGGHLVPLRVTGPVGDPVDSHIAVLGGSGPRTVVVRMDLRTAAGSGASGGLGAGLAAGLGARLLPRFEVMFDHVDFDAALADADLVLTAEGAIDEQTPRGKMPAEVARRAKRHGKPVIALAGTIGIQARVNYDVGIDAFATILPEPVCLDAALRRGAEFLTDATKRVLRLVMVGTAIA